MSTTTNTTTSTTTKWPVLGRRDARRTWWLSDREKFVLDQRYDLTTGQRVRTLDALGQVMGVTRERVRQIEAKALFRLSRAGEAAAGDYPWSAAAAQDFARYRALLR